MQHGRRLIGLAGMGAAAALVVVLSAWALLMILVPPQELAERGKTRVVQTLSRQLGQPVAAGSASAQWLPPRISISELRIGNDDGGAPLVSDGVLVLNLSFWPFVRSFGKQVVIETLDVREPVINIVRRPDGSWNVVELWNNVVAASAAPRPTGPATDKRPPGDELQLGDVHVRGATLRMVDRVAGPENTAVLMTRLHIVTGDLSAPQPVAVQASAALRSDEPNLVITWVKKPSAEGAPPAIQGSVGIQRLALERMAEALPAPLNAMIPDGRLTMDGAFHTRPDGAWAVNGDVGLDDMQLRGQSAEGSFRLDAVVHPRNPSETRADLRAFQLGGPGMELAGTVSLQRTPPHLRFDLAGPRVDLDQLMHAMPRPVSMPQTDSLLPKTVAQGIRRLVASGTVTLDHMVRGPLDVQGFKASVVVHDGVLHVERGVGRIFRGSIRLDGSRVNLDTLPATWRMNASIDDANMETAMRQLLGTATMTGTLGARVQVSGTGTQWAAIRDELRGLAVVSLGDATMKNADLLAALTAAVNSTLIGINEQRVAKILEPAGTRFTSLRTNMRIRNGWMVLRSPLKFSSPFGNGTLTGRIGLDGKLDLEGDVELFAEVIADVTEGVVTPEMSVVLPVRVEGTLVEPRIIPAKPREVAESLLRSAPRPQEILRFGRRAAEREVRERLQRLMGK